MLSSKIFNGLEIALCDFCLYKIIVKNPFPSRTTGKIMEIHWLKCMGTLTAGDLWVQTLAVCGFPNGTIASKKKKEKNTVCIALWHFSLSPYAVSLSLELWY